MIEKSDQLHVTSDIPLKFNVNIKLGEKSYHVQTEHGGIKEPLLTTRIYHKGEIVYSKKQIALILWTKKTARTSSMSLWRIIIRAP